MPVTDHPPALQALYGISDLRSDVLLAKERMHISSPDRDIDVEGEIYLKLNPKPTIEFRSEYQEKNIDFFFGVISDKVSASIETFPLTHWNISEIKPITAEANPCHISHPKDKFIQSARFHLINFQGYLGSPVLRDNGVLNRGRVDLSADAWRITIDSLPETDKTIKILRNMGGYAITHVGKLEYEGGKRFRASKGNDVLTKLAFFLSFARGAWVAIPLCEGYNSNGEPVWFDWGVPAKRSAWTFVYSWFDGHHATQSLQSAFQGFYRLCQADNWKEALPKIIYWYILSNTLKNIDGSIILAQTILELLAWNYLVVHTGVLSQDTFSRISASEQFKLLLAFLNIPLDVPEGLDTLTKEARSRNLDALGLITNVRNALVHPAKSAKAIPTNSELLIEAWNLALWYVELVLLRLFGYEGSYASRVLGRARWAGEVEPVPWKKSKE